MTTRARHAGGGLLRDIVPVVLASALAGVVGGVLWRWLWTPLRGTVLDGTWYPATNASEFSATGIFVLLGLGLGVLLGAVSALLTDRRELLALGLVLVGSVLAAATMIAVGRLGMPADPNDLARTAADGTRLPGTLRITGWTPVVAWPAGALLGLFVVFVGLSPKPVDQQSPVDPAG